MVSAAGEMEVQVRDVMADCLWLLRKLQKGIPFVRLESTQDSEIGHANGKGTRAEGYRGLVRKVILYHSHTDPVFFL
jgi:hypothetical protein